MAWFIPPVVHGRSTNSKNNRKSMQLPAGDLPSTIRVAIQRTLHDVNTNLTTNTTGYNQHLKDDIASYFRQHGDSLPLRLFGLFPNLFGQSCPSCDRNCGKCPTLPKCPPVLACEICKVCEICTISLIGTPLLALPPPELSLGSATLLTSPDADKPALGPAEQASVLLSATVPTTTPPISIVNPELEETASVTTTLSTTKPPPSAVVKPESDQTTESTTMSATMPPIPTKKPEQTAALTTPVAAPPVQAFEPELITKPPSTLLEPESIQGNSIYLRKS